MSVAETVRQWVTEARHIAVLTGAGVSAESGVPTFRDATDSLWARYDPMTLATPEAFAEEPSLVWAWYLRRAQLIRQVAPNAGHVALAALERTHQVSVITQNVDNLHERAGSTAVTHLHGGLFDYRCFDCSRPFTGQIAEPAEIPERVDPPHCQECFGWIRPGIVWFGESLPVQAIDDAVEACSNCDLMLVIGTSGVVQPAGSLPFLAVDAGTKVVEINPQETALSDALHLCWRATAAEALPELVRE